MREYVETVCGLLPIDNIGFTLTHEHVYMDTTKIYFKSYGESKMSDEKVTLENRAGIVKDLHSIVFGYKDNIIFDNVNDMVNELREFYNHGGRTIFEVSTIDLGRDPLMLREISEKSGVNIVMGGTYYYFPSIDLETQEIILNKGKTALADLMIREFHEGVGSSGIKPGVLGEVGLQYDSKTNSILIHAAMIAQKETGAPVIVHSAPFEVLDVAEEEGADLSKIVMGHWTMNDKVEEVVKRGAWISFDQFGMNFPGIISDEQRVKDVIEIFERGWEDHLLLSQDVCWKVRLKKYGGEGYTDLMLNTLPKLKQLGITQSQINNLMCDNPKRLLR